MTPHWIPELETQNIGEEFSSYENRLYDIFRRDFILSHPTYDNLTVTVRRREEEEDGKWAGFFHITSTEDHATRERITDVRRCERAYDIHDPPSSIAVNARNAPTQSARNQWSGRNHGEDGQG